MKQTLKDYCKKICDTELGCNKECKFWDYCDHTFSKWEHLTLKEAIAKKKQVDNILNDDDSYQARLDKVLSKFEKGNECSYFNLKSLEHYIICYKGNKFELWDDYRTTIICVISLDTVEHLLKDLSGEK